MRVLMLIPVLVLSACGPAWDVEKETLEDLSAPNNRTESDINNCLKIVVFDVGQGDSALVIAPDGEAALIDTGPQGSGDSKINPYLSENDISLRYLFISHPDIDHAGAVQEIDKVPEEFEAGQTYKLGEVQIEILAKDCEYADGTKIDCGPDDDNAHSAAMLVTYGAFKYLTTGDLPGGGGEPPYDTIDMETHLATLAGDINLLHVSHHGSNTSTNQNLLDTTKPEAAIISVGNNNDYWHPHPSVIERLLNAGVEIYQTERGWLREEFMDNVQIENGDIVIQSIEFQ